MAINIVTNGDFSDGETGWTFASDGTLTHSDSGQILNIYRSGGTYGTAYQDTGVPVAAGQQVTFSFTVRNSSNTAKTFRATVRSAADTTGQLSEQYTVPGVGAGGSQVPYLWAKTATHDWADTRVEFSEIPDDNLPALLLDDVVVTVRTVKARDWRTHPQSHEGHLFLLEPDTVFAASLNYATTVASGKFGTTGIWQYLFVDTITVGDSSLATVKPGMTLLLGTAPGLDDLGRTYVRGVTTVGSEAAIAVWASNNTHDGELAPAATSYVTVLDDYRVWLKPPYYDSATGVGYFDGTEGPIGTTYHTRPMANGGPGWAGLADATTNLATVVFDAGGSYAASPMAVLDDYTDIISEVSALQHGLETAGHEAEYALDGDAGTYYEAPNSATYLTLTFNRSMWRVRKYTLTAQDANTAPKTWTLENGDGDVLDRRTDQTGWSPGETRTFYVDRWRPDWQDNQIKLDITAPNSGSTIRIVEFRLYVEKRHGEAATALAPVNIEASSEMSSATPATGVLYASGPYWESAELPAWIEFEFSSRVSVTNIVLHSEDADYAPSQFAVQARDGGGWLEADSFTKTDWATNAIVDFGEPTAAGSTRWRVYVEAAQNASTVRLQRVTLSGYAFDGDFAAWDVKDGTITVGTAASERITATFPPGFRWVDLTVTDSNGATHTKHIPVFVAGYYTPERPAGSPTSTRVFSATHPISHIFDKDNATYGQTNTTGAIPITVTYTFSSPISIRGYTTRFGHSQITYTFEYTPASGGDWVTADTRVLASGGSAINSYDLSAPIDVSAVRWVVTSASDIGGSYFRAYTLDLVMTPLLMDGPITNFEVTRHTLTPEGQDITFRLNEAAPLTTYPDGTLVMYWEDEWIGGTKGNLADAGAEGREHMRFIGWIDTESGRIDAGEHDAAGEVEVNCVDAGGRLRRLAGFNTLFEREQVTQPPGGINGMFHANVDRIAYVVARHMSTAPDVVDFYTSDMWDYWWLPRFLAQGQTLWDMIDGVARAAEMRLTCDRTGALRIVRDQMLLPEADKTTTVQAVIDERDWVELQRARTRPSRNHWVWASAVGCPESEYVSSANPSAIATTTYTAVAPGAAPGQGPGSVESGEQLAESLAAFLVREGNRYAARLNQPESLYRVRLAHGATGNIDPARMEWVTLTVTSDTVDERGVTLAAARFLPYLVDIEYDHVAGTKTILVEMEREVTGTPAQAYTPPE